jgi:hypothetical protein
MYWRAVEKNLLVKSSVQDVRKKSWSEKIRLIVDCANFVGVKEQSLVMATLQDYSGEKQPRDIGENVLNAMKENCNTNLRLSQDYAENVMQHQSVGKNAVDLIQDSEKASKILGNIGTSKIAKRLETKESVSLSTLAINAICVVKKIFPFAFFNSIMSKRKNMKWLPSYVIVGSA